MFVLQTAFYVVCIYCFCGYDVIRVSLSLSHVKFYCFDCTRQACFQSRRMVRWSISAWLLANIPCRDMVAGLHVFKGTERCKPLNGHCFSPLSFLMKAHVLQTDCLWSAELISAGCIGTVCLQGSIHCPSSQHDTLSCGSSKWQWLSNCLSQFLPQMWFRQMC